MDSRSNLDGHGYLHQLSHLNSNRLNTTNLSTNLFSSNNVNMSSISSITSPINSAFPSTRKYLPDIGWCLSMKSPITTTTAAATGSSLSDDFVFLVLFNDGRAIQIDGHADTVLDFQTNRLHQINSQLPQDIKEMLALFSQFL